MWRPSSRSAEDRFLRKAVRSGAREIALLGLLLLCLLWFTRLNLPFSRVTGFADYIGNENGRIAANPLRYGLAETRGDQIRNLEQADKAQKLLSFIKSC